jgi:quinol monooxygenase YgiN
MPRSIVATLRIKDGMAEQFEEIAGRLVQAVRANEPGCLLYTLSRGDDPLTYVFMERYADDEALAAHRATDHFKTIGREMGACLDGAPAILRMHEIV